MMKKLFAIIFLLALAVTSFGCISYYGAAKAPKGNKTVVVGRWFWPIIIPISLERAYEVDVETGETVRMEVEYK